MEQSAIFASFNVFEVCFCLELMFLSNAFMYYSIQEIKGKCGRIMILCLLLTRCIPVKT